MAAPTCAKLRPPDILEAMTEFAKRSNTSKMVLGPLMSVLA